MATSGTNTFELDVADIIEEAYERMQIELRSGYDSKTARRSLNLLLQDLSNRQINLWKVAEISVPLIQGIASYQLANSVTDVINAVIRKDDIDLQMNRLSRKDYQTRPDKTTQGRSSQYYVHRGIPTIISVYPAPEDNNYTLILQCTTRIEDVNAMTETIDVPVRLQSSVISGLAYYLSLKKKPEMSVFLKSVYEEELVRALEEDRERVSSYFIPKLRRV